MILDIDISQDGKILASGSEDKTIIVWSRDISSGKIEFNSKLEGHKSAVTSVKII
jgi:WD40 repeat protein